MHQSQDSFSSMRKHTNCARDDKCFPLTSQSFSSETKYRDIRNLHQNYEQQIVLLCLGKQEICFWVKRTLLFLQNMFMKNTQCSTIFYPQYLTQEVGKTKMVPLLEQQIKVEFHRIDLPYFII